MFRHVLFDLDGTLTDSKEGIIKSVEYALLKLGESTEGRLDQHIVVGPPMMTTFTQVYGFSEEKARHLYNTFQERYGTKGRFENRPFPGILTLLDQLKEAGIKSYVATSKPTVHARAICEKFGISQRVELVAGSTLGGSETKADVIQQVLDTIGPQAEGNTVMVGDRKYDVIGAREKHLPVILVGFGYGSKDEQEAYPPDYFAPDVSALGNIILHTHS